MLVAPLAREEQKPPERERAAARGRMSPWGWRPSTVPSALNPLRPPIYECSVGHFICSSCRPKLVRNNCHLCSAETTFKRCLGMERLMESVMVPCSNAKYGCAEKLTYYQKEGHEKECLNAPCFCPEFNCGFAGPTAALFDHFTSVHKWPPTTIRYSRKVEFHVQPGLHVLCTKDRQILLLNVAVEPFGHGVSVVWVQPKAANSKFKCQMSYHNSMTGYSQYSIYKIGSSSLSDGLPKRYSLILPKDEVSDDGKGILLSITIEDPKEKPCQPICLKPVHGA